MDSEPNGIDISSALGQLYRTEASRVLATLIRLVGDVDLAEEGLHEAFAAALRQWPRDGWPDNPRAWLVSAGRFKAIDSLRRRANTLKGLAELKRGLSAFEPDSFTAGTPNLEIEDDQLRLIFLCCHPVNPIDAQVALTLREVCGLTTEEIAEAYLVDTATLAKRIVRAKARLREKRIPYQVPPLAELPARLASVLQVIYLVFNEGYSASSGPTLLRVDLSAQALQLGRLLVELLPQAEALGLLSLMLIQESRRNARVAADGSLVLLEDQDRTLWNHAQLEEGLALVDRALASRGFGVYVLQAAIAALHTREADQVDWNQIILLYDILLRAQPSPVVELNRAVAVTMRDGPAAGLALVDGILGRGDLEDYHLAHSLRADFCRRLGQQLEARAAYERALSLAKLEPERQFLRRRLNELIIF